mmetsp:Transcript_18985/g.48418  ORF Transcript_18985/g.48418 Transcript_18985/m.48418 type:complete len:121 (-) Transcript_18985:125-487(-)
MNCAVPPLTVHLLQKGRCHDITTSRHHENRKTSRHVALANYLDTTRGRNGDMVVVALLFPSAFHMKLIWTRSLPFSFRFSPRSSLLATLHARRTKGVQANEHLLRLRKGTLEEYRKRWIG